VTQWSFKSQVKKFNDVFYNLRTLPSKLKLQLSIFSTTTTSV